MFISRWNNYKDNYRKFGTREDCVQRHLYKQFQLPGHTVFLQDTYDTLIDKTLLRHPVSVKITGFISLRQKHLWDLMLKVLTELLSYICTVKLFLFLDLDGLFYDNSRCFGIIWKISKDKSFRNKCFIFDIYIDLFVDDIQSLYTYIYTYIYIYIYIY